MAEENKSSLDPLAALCKRRGFIYHSSEIYGGMPGFWDYGPLGCELKQNVKQAWWQFTVRGRSDVAGLDATIIMHPKIWKASGHLDTFADPMTMCKQCKKLMRADQIDDIRAELGKKAAAVNPAYALSCPHCGGEMTEPKPSTSCSRLSWVRSTTRRTWPIFVLRRRRPSSRSSQTCSPRAASRCRSASRRWARASATR